MCRLIDGSWFASMKIYGRVFGATGKTPDMAAYHLRRLMKQAPAFPAGIIKPVME